MDWTNAKKITLISLILINVFLYILHKNTDVKYVLTNEQSENIKVALYDNNIGLYSTLPTNYEPMAELELRKNKLNLNVNNFNQLVEPSEEFILLENDNKTTYLVGSTRILLDDNEFIIDTTDNKELSKINGNKITYFNNIINDMGNDFTNYQFDKEIQSINSVKYEFREVYNGQIIYDNYIQFIVVDDYLYKIQGKHLTVTGLASAPQEIISSDIALFTFMSVIKENQIYDTDEVFINSIDMVYYKNYENNLNNDVQSVCIPAYRIYTEQGELPFIINAYTNKLMNF